MKHFEQMNMEFRRARSLAERGQWADAADAYESARQLAEMIGATESERQGRIFRDLMEANANTRYQGE